MSTTVVNATVYAIVDNGANIVGAWLSVAAAQAVCDTLPGTNRVVPVPINDAS